MIHCDLDNEAESEAHTKRPDRKNYRSPDLAVGNGPVEDVIQYKPCSKGKERLHDGAKDPVLAMVLSEQDC
jgi:hypothetical protein